MQIGMVCFILVQPLSSIPMTISLSELAVKRGASCKSSNSSAAVLVGKKQRKASVVPWEVQEPQGVREREKADSLVSHKLPHAGELVISLNGHWNR